MLGSLKTPDGIGYTTLFTRLRALLERYDLVDLLHSYPFVWNSVYKNIKQVVLNRFEMNSMSYIQSSTKCPKLRTYKLFRSYFVYMNLTSGYAYRNIELVYVD